MNIFKKNFFAIVILVFLLFSFIGGVEAANLNDWGDTLDKVAGNDAAGYDTEVKITTIVGNIIKAVLSLLGVIFLVLTIYGGFVWMNARGREAEVEKAQNIIRATIIGLAIVVAAYAISYFVIEVLTNETLVS
jgi:cbb3-type cytochrome oxidase subunit 3